ncbi:MAG: TatD family hydrolase [Lachnospiraceae bacterium]|nr:TatD family hydrolase [Lachnospiraceae bacterium]
MKAIFDTHVHYDDEAFDEDRDELIKSLAERGVAKAVDVGASISSSRRARDIAAAYPDIFFSAGVHPEDVPELEKAGLDEIRQLLKEEKCVALGEIGLDYHWKDVAPELQKHWFEEQLKLAEESGKPVIIHSREAARDTADMLHAHPAVKGVIHCFSYGREMAREFLDMGYYIGIGGVLTYKNAKKLVKAAMDTPMERIVLETDGPYLSPEPRRGKRNDSANIIYVIVKLAQLKGISEEEVRAAAWENAHRLYGLSAS